MLLSEAASGLIDLIEQNGYEAYAVGGCVRDNIMNRVYDDIDIASSAKPNELECILNDNNIKFVETGIKHGTITVLYNNFSFEVTSFRADGNYFDSRHPENVTFVCDIEEDLARRDFTVNAMAYNNRKGLIDLYGGCDDIENGIIRAVGDADKRFKEDALRIMRSVRFASVLGFELEENTEKAAFDNKELLKNVSAERIYAELSKLLMGENVFRVLVKYKEIIAVCVPELEYIFNVEQNTKWHIYDVWQHTAKAVEQSPKDLAIRYTMLLHDLGKAFSKTTDENGTDHFKGHQKISESYADCALKRLKAPKEIYNRVMAVVPIHDIHIGTDRKNVKKWLSRLGESTLRDLVEVKRADKLAQNPEMTAPEIKRLDITESIIDDIIMNGEPFTIKDLKINGNDIMLLGFKGRQIGEIQKALLDMVINENLKNEKVSLIDAVKKCFMTDSD